MPIRFDSGIVSEPIQNHVALTLDRSGSRQDLRDHAAGSKLLLTSSVTLK